jgi:hypothetical protein
MENNKYITLWKKYLPVIRIQMKKSLRNEQELQLNKIEFEAKGDRDLSGYTFNLEIEKGKVTNDIRGTAVARDLFQVLVEDVGLKEFLEDKRLKISLRRNFILKIRADIMSHKAKSLTKDP